MNNQQPDPNKPNILEQINAICKEFRRAWRKGERSKIEDWLGKVEENARSNLFSNLLDIEILNRVKSGEHPDSRDYLKRFPPYSSQIRQVFDESTMGSIDEGIRSGVQASDADQEITRTQDFAATNRLGDYELIRELGRGGMGIVYEARDAATGNRVALKTLPTGGHGQEVNADKLYRFRKEFRRLSEINHPNLVGMQTLEVDGDQWFFTMDVIDGTDFLSYVRPDDRLDEERLRSALEQLARGVLALHQRGIIHRDLKPSNVLVADDGTVSILDFGLASEMQRATDMTQTKSGLFGGTPPYAAPEQMFGERTEASDWYAMGTILFEALTGDRPFRDPDPMALLRRKQEQNPPIISEQEDLPSDLTRLTDGLIRREPSQRMEVDEIGKFLNLATETRAAGSTAMSRGSEASGGSAGSTGSVDDATIDFSDFQGEEELVLIGRESQLEALERARQEMLSTGMPVLVWISGLSGEGKSSLCEKFLQPLRQGSEMLVLSGRCYDRESVPFKAVDCIVDTLVRYLRSRRGKWLESEQPDDVEFLAAIFPLFRRVDWIAQYAIHDLSRTEPQKIRGRAFYSLRQFLTAIARRTPIVIHLDDLQWGDADSARVWQELLVHDEAPPLLMLGSYRSDEAGGSTFLQTWNQLKQSTFHKLETRQVTVSALTQEQCLELVEQRTGLAPDVIQDQVDQLFTETAGNPYFLEQLLEGFDPGSNTFRHIPLDEIIAGRLSRLPETAIRLLEVIAISGQPIRIDEAAMVANTGKAAAATLTHMRSERLVRLFGTGSDAMVETWHDKVRESVLEALSKERRKQLHMQLAEEIEGKQDHTADDWLQSLRRMSTPGEYAFRTSDRVLDLCQHFNSAGDQRAFIYTWLAAEQAMRAYAVGEAFDLFQQAKSSLRNNETSTVMYRFWMGMGRVSLWHKSTDQSSESFAQALEHASDQFQAAEACAGLQAVNMQLGRFEEALRWMDLALKELGIKQPRGAFGRLISILSKNLRLFFIPANLQIAKRESTRRKMALCHEVLLDGFYAKCEQGVVVLAESVARGSLNALKTNDETKAAMGLIVLAQVCAAFGMRWLAQLYFRRARQFEATINDPDLAGVYYNYAGMAEYYSGNLEATVLNFERAQPLLTRCCRFEHLQTCVHVHRHALAYVGDSQSDLEKSRKVLEFATATGNVQGICWGSYDVASALARSGKLSDSAEYMQQANKALPNERFVMTSAIRASTEGYIRLQLSDYITASKLSEYAWSVVRDGWFAMDNTLSCVPILIESLAGPNWLSTPTKQDRRLLNRALRRATLASFLLPNQQSHLRRAYGRAYWRLGKHRRAIRNFERAVKLGEKKGMKYQQAKCLLDLAAVKVEGRDQNRSNAIELLKEMESVIPRAESWLLGDQYDEDVIAPEFDLAAWQRENGPVTPYLDNEK